MSAVFGTTFADNPTLTGEVRVLEIQQQMGGYRVGCPQSEVLEQFHSVAEDVAGTGIPYSFFFYMEQGATVARSCRCLRELNVVDCADDDIKIFEEPRDWFVPGAGTRFRRVHDSLVRKDLSIRL